MSSFETKSNFNKFMKRFKADTNNILVEKPKEVIIKLFENMKKDMITEIQNHKSEWMQYGSPLANVTGDDITYKLRKDGMGGTLYVGASPSTEKIKMADGREVNPYLFIEFGWGITGENHPVRYASSRGWEYNINNHEKGWVFMGTDKEFHGTRGRQGIDFFYNVISKYRREWKNILSREVNKK